MSGLGVDRYGVVRSAYEFKDMYDRTGEYTGEYCCPFCEVRYVDKCVTTRCKNAPHFALPPLARGHRGKCNGEAASPPGLVAEIKDDGARRRKVRDVDFPEALVAASPERGRFRKKVEGFEPSPEEVESRRRSVNTKGFLASKFTSSLLRTFVFAHGDLKELAKKQAQTCGLPSTPEFNRAFREVMESRPLELYGERLTYNTVFMNSRLSPPETPRIYQGIGTVQREGQELVIWDKDAWPKERKGSEKLDFFVVADAEIEHSTPRTHKRLHANLAAAVENGTRITWHAYGNVQHSEANQFVLRLESLDHLFLE